MTDVSMVRANMRRLMFTAAVSLVFFCSPLAARAEEIVAVNSLPTGPYEEALSGFKSICRASFLELDGNTLSKSELLAEIYKARPRLVLAFGNTSLYKIKGLQGIPVVYALVSNPTPLLAGATNITGVSMNIPVRRQLEEFLKVSPYSKSIGVIYDPDNSSRLAQEAMKAASSLDIKVVLREVNRSTDVMRAIDDIKGIVDAFLMLPDTTVVTETNVEYLLLTSYENHIPVIAFSEKYLEGGALISVSLDVVDIGRQAGDMANRVLKGTPVDKILVAQPRSASVSLNMKTARKFDQ